MMPCPCTTCLNHIEHKAEEVQFYLFKYGIDQSYIKWDKHGEKDKEATTAQKPVNATTVFVDDTDFDMDFGSEIPTDGLTTVEMVNATKESFDKDDLAKFQKLLLDAEKPLYKGFPNFTKFSTIVKLLNLKGKCGASDKLFTELLGLLKKMLPADSQAWRTIDEKFHKIAKDLRNLQLGISADGVDVNSGTLHHNVERELAISKDSVSETIRWISYGPRTTIVKYEAYNINGYTFHTKSNDGIVYQNNGVSIDAVDLHISKEFPTTRQAFYYGVLQEIWVQDYHFRKICNTSNNVSQQKYVSGALLHNTTAQDIGERPLNVV
uniref:Transposase-associated domain-containing protein n=1 Tax=Tanacetum cinerariifolium TaxID=118510 RepID=A0A699HKN6_TANCI|nr:hypothetical protein [Tanacetum cinerariifolium]